MAEVTAGDTETSAAHSERAILRSFHSEIDATHSTLTPDSMNGCKSLACRWLGSHLRQQALLAVERNLAGCKVFRRSTRGELRSVLTHAAEGSGEALVNVHSRRDTHSNATVK